MKNEEMNIVAGPRDGVPIVRSLSTARAVRVIWAEKTALGLLLAEVGVVASLWLMALLAAGRSGADHVFASIGVWRVEQGFLVILALWISFRVVDFIAGGSTYRLFYRSVP